MSLILKNKNNYKSLSQPSVAPIMLSGEYVLCLVPVNTSYTTAFTISHSVTYSDIYSIIRCKIKSIRPP